MATRVQYKTVTIAPVETALFSAIKVSAHSALTIQVTNLSGTETFTGTVRSRLDSSHPMARSTLGDLVDLLPGESRTVSVDLPASSELDVVGTMTGAGGPVGVTVLTRNSTAPALGRTR